MKICFAGMKIIQFVAEFSCYISSSEITIKASKLLDNLLKQELFLFT